MTRGPKPQPRLPFEPLEQWIAVRYPRDENKYTPHLVANEFVGDLVGVDRQTIHNWRQQGIPIYAADRAATRLGTHPTLIWPNWYRIQ